MKDYDVCLQALESYRVPPEHKAYLRGLKIRTAEEAEGDRH